MPTSNILTLEDFVTESLNFLDGDVYYKLKKECLDLQLESLNYIRESNDILNTLIVENSDTNGKLSNLKTNILKKISSIWKTIIKAIKTFLKNVINVFTNSQNKQIEKIKSQAKEAGDKIDDLLKNASENEEKINQLKTELDNLLSNIEEKNGIITYLKSTNFDKEIQLRHLNAKLRDVKASHEVEDLHKKVLTLMDANKNNKEDANKILKLMSLVLAENISVDDVSSFILDIDKYIVKFRQIFTINSHENTDDVILLFAKNYINAGTRSVQKINILITSINTLKDDIEKAMGDTVEGSFTVKDIENTDKVIQENFPNDQLFVYNSDKMDEYDESTRKIIDNNPELFAKYVSAITEVSGLFKKGVGEYIDYTKSIIDARQWALQMEAGIVNIIRRIDMNK